MNIAKRVKELPVSPTRRYLGMAKAAEERGVKVIRLSIGQPDLPTPREYFEALKQIPEGTVRYPNATGIEEMRKAQQAYYARYGIQYAADDIFVTGGAMEGIRFAITATCNPDDAMLLIEPFYTNYQMITHLFGVHVRAVTARAEDNYTIPDESVFEAQYDKNVRAILLSNPCNPNGRVYRREELETIVHFAKKHDLVVISDEVYREFNFTPHPFISLYEFEEIRDQLILLDSASKKYAACGTRIGTAATSNTELKQAFAKLCQMNLGVSASEQSAVAALSRIDERYHEGVREIYRVRREAMLEVFREMPEIRYSEPEGAFYSLVKLPVDNAEKFIQWLLNDFSVDGETVLVTPAADFYYTPGLGDDEIRISYCVEKDDLVRALRIIQKGLAVYPGRK